MMGWFSGILLRISLEVTKFSGLTICLTIISYLDTEYLDSLASSSLLIHAPNILTCSEGFPDFLPSFSTEEKGTKGTNVDGPWLGSTYVRSAYTRGACTGSTYTKSACTGIVSKEGAYVKGTDIEGTGTESISTKSTYIKGAYTRGIFSVGACTRASTYSDDTCTRTADIKSTCIEVFCIKDIPIEDICIWSTCVWGIGTYMDSTDAIEHLEMHLQYFQILEVGGAKLKMRVETCW